MDRNWTQFEGRDAGGCRLESFLGERDGKGFFSGKDEARSKPNLIELMEAGTAESDALLASWSLARRFAHQNLLRVYAAGMAEIEGISVIYAVLEIPEDDISEMVPRRALEEQEVQAMLRGSAHALEYLHNHGVVHGAVLPPAIFLAGGEYKLGVDTISTGGADRKAADVRQLGSTLVWILSGGADAPNQRPSAEAIARLDLPFREIAIGCLNSGWTATQLVAALEGRYVPPAEELPVVSEPLPPAPGDIGETQRAPVRRSSERWVLATILIVVLLLVMAYLLGGRGGHNSTASSDAAPGSDPPPTATAPAPATTASVAPPEHDAGTADRGAAVPQGHGPWGVVAAAYATRAGAQQRAELIRSHWKQFQPSVFSSGTGTSRYLVVLESGLTKEGAEGLMRRAKDAGVAKDSYVTKLSAR